jgi:hypothetical protein
MDGQPQKSSERAARWSNLDRWLRRQTEASFSKNAWRFAYNTDQSLSALRVFGSCILYCLWNIMLRPDGYAKVLDFGIAKLTEQRPTSDHYEVGTTAVLQTRPGLVLGTGRTSGGRPSASCCTTRSAASERRRHHRLGNTSLPSDPGAPPCTNHSSAKGNTCQA